MNKPYDVIYLQWNHPIFSDERDSVCWCQDQIYDDDVEYCCITAAELRALQTRNELLTKALADLLEDVEFAQPQIEPGLIGKRQIRKAHIALEGEKSLKDHPAFGSWSGRDIDSVDYQREERHGEEQE